MGCEALADFGVSDAECEHHGGVLDGRGAQGDLAGMKSQTKVPAAEEQHYAKHHGGAVQVAVPLGQAGASGRKDAKGARGDGSAAQGAMQRAASGDHCLMPAVLAVCNAAQGDGRLPEGVMYDMTAG